MPDGALNSGLGLRGLRHRVTRERPAERDAWQFKRNGEWKRRVRLTYCDATACRAHRATVQFFGSGQVFDHKRLHCSSPKDTKKSKRAQKPGARNVPFTGNVLGTP